MSESEACKTNNKYEYIFLKAEIKKNKIKNRQNSLVGTGMLKATSAHGSAYVVVFSIHKMFLYAQLSTNLSIFPDHFLLFFLKSKKKKKKLL